MFCVDRDAHYADVFESESLNMEIKTHCKKWHSFSIRIEISRDSRVVKGGRLKIYCDFASRVQTPLPATKFCLQTYINKSLIFKFIVIMFVRAIDSSTCFNLNWSCKGLGDCFLHFKLGISYALNSINKLCLASEWGLPITISMNPNVLSQQFTISFKGKG